MKKVCVVSNMFPSNSFPAYGTFVRNFVDDIPKDSFSVSKVVMLKSKTRLGKVARYLSFYIRTIFKLIFNTYDIVYIHYLSYSAFPVLFVCLFKKMNLISNVHGSDVMPVTKPQKILHRFTIRSIKKSTKIVVPSQHFSSIVQKKYNVDADLITIYPSSGVNTDIFKKTTSNKLESKEFTFKKELKYIGFVSRVTEGKGWDTFIQAVKLTQKDARYDDVRFILVGNGDKSKECERLIFETKTASKIDQFDLLPQEDLAVVYSNIEFFVFPSRREESLGLVGLEAMACGTPVIGSNNSSIKDYIIDGKNGFLFDMKNYEDLYQKMNDYFDLTEQKKEELGIEAYITAQYYKNSVIKSRVEEILS